ncbi:MAG: hypothetical protein AB7Q29_04390 [Vicinamibacterales bacterium]
MSDETRNARPDEVFDTIDPAKRRFIKTLVAGAGFAAPMVASFSMKGVSSYVVHAQVGSNFSQQPPG